ncbi:MAG: FecR family protein, partial [Chitinophagaceae bacterium]
MEEKNLWILLGKHLNGEITEKERKELQKLVSKNRDNLSYLIEFLEDQWKPKPPVTQFPESPLLNQKWGHLSERLFNERSSENEKEEFISGKENSSKRIFPAWFKIAATILILTGGIYFLAQKLIPGHHLKQYEIVAEGGIKKHIELPDGTDVWLNADSKLSYNNEFNDKNRDIYLDGEAYFQVKKDASAPFTVNAGGITIKVLGTVFNVSAYKTDPDIQTTLISGKVQVSLNDDPGKKIILTPHEKLTVMNEQHTTI